MRCPGKRMGCPGPVTGTAQPGQRPSPAERGTEPPPRSPHANRGGKGSCSTASSAARILASSLEPFVGSRRTGTP